MASRQKKHRRSKKSGLPPGALIYVGNRDEEELRITRISYFNKTSSTEIIPNLTSLANWSSWEGINWINFDGIHDTLLIEQVGKMFNIHSLIMEDIVNSEQRPKVELYTDQVFLTLKMIEHLPTESDYSTEQMSFVLGPNYLLTFQERPGDVFNPVRDRIKNPESRLHQKGHDFLLYSLIDLVVDQYFLILEVLEDEVEEIEEQFFMEKDSLALHHLQHRKRQLQQMRRTVNPLREAIAFLYRDESQLITENTQRYINDVHDHLVQVQEIIDYQREFYVELRETHLALLGNRTNEVMKVLTIIATIFIPLTFIVGVYGMNFTKMPELNWKWGYPGVWLIMVVSSLIMIRYFRKKHWM